MTQDIGKRWMQIEKVIEEAVEAIVRRMKTKENKWFAIECERTVIENASKTEANEDKAIYQYCWKKGKESVKKAKRIHIEKKIKGVEEKYKNKEMRNFYQEGININRISTSYNIL